MLIPLARRSETFRQYAERRIREIAADHDLTQVEDWWRAEWSRAVAAAAEAGQTLPARTLNMLSRYDRYRLLHDHPEAAPPHYVMPVPDAPGRAGETQED
jgi:hypothetical protein